MRYAWAVSRDPFGPPYITRMGGPTSDECLKSATQLMTVAAVFFTAKSTNDRRERRRSEKTLKGMCALGERLPPKDQLQMLDVLISPIANYPTDQFGLLLPELKPLGQYWMRGNGDGYMETFLRLSRRPGIGRVMMVLAVRAAAYTLAAGRDSAE